MRNIVLQIAIRKSTNEKTGRETFKLQVQAQSSRSIRYDAANGYRLRCSGMPEISNTAFILRGSDPSYDNIWTNLPTTQITNVINVLNEYAAHGGFSIISECSNNQVTIALINEKLNSYEQVYDPYEDYGTFEAYGSVRLRTASSSNNTRSIIDVSSVVKVISELSQSSSEDFKVQMICEHCGKASDDCQKVAGPMNYMQICKKCLATLVKCEVCSTLVNSVKKFTNSVGTQRNICVSCSKTLNCESCGFMELRFDTKNLNNIDDNGNNKTQKSCLKCIKSASACKRCGHFYESKLPACPCSIPTEFKQLGIHPYSTDVTQILTRDSDCELGMEIEVGVACKNRIQYEEIYKHTANILGTDAIMVYDRSIDEIDTERHIPNKFRGFEIVTRPMNYENMIDFIIKLTDKRHQNLRSWDVETTGIHIHVARNKTIQLPTGQTKTIPNLTKIEIGKLLVFINAPRNRLMIKHIARRYNTKYAKLRAKKITDYKDMSRECHYDALNTNKTHTIEFRIFRGSLSKDTIMSYLQFVFSAIEFVRRTPSTELSAVRYVDWIKKTNKSSFRQLKERLATFDRTGKKETLEVGGEA